MKLKTLSFVVVAHILSTSLAHAQENILRVGYVRVSPQAEASDATGDFLPSPRSGVSLDVTKTDALFLSYARRFTDHLEAELVTGWPPAHDVVAKLNPAIVPAGVVDAFHGQVIGHVRRMSPTLFINYLWRDPSRAWRPLAGLGLNYTRFDKGRTTAMGDALNGGRTAIALDDSLGLAAQGGVSYRIHSRWNVIASASTARVVTELTTDTGGARRIIDIRFHPVVVVLSAGYTF
jgi:outer membrane protein